MFRSSRGFGLGGVVMKLTGLGFVVAYLVSSFIFASPADAAPAAKGEGAVAIVGKPVELGRGITETVGEIMERERLAPPLGLVAPREKRPEFEFDYPVTDNPEAPGVSQWPPSGTNERSSSVGPLLPQTLGTSFKAIALSESTYIPPDTMGDVGPTQILVHANGRIKVFDKSGAVGGLNATDVTFWTSVAGTGGISDPEVRYDRLSGRWFLNAITIAESSNNKIVIAVSSGPTITDQTSFTFYSFPIGTPAPGDASSFCDYPTLGVDANALYMGCNMFNSAGTALLWTSAFVIRKSSVTGGGPIVVTGFTNISNGTAGPGPYAPMGVDDDDPTATEGYIIGSDIVTSGLLQIRRVSTPGGTPTLSGNLSLTVPATTNPILQVASGSSPSIDANDRRLIKAAIHKNKLTGISTLWTVHGNEVNSSCVSVAGGGRNGERWYEISGSAPTAAAPIGGTPTLVQAGTLCDSAGTNPRGYSYGSVIETGQGHMALGATFASSPEFAGVAVAGRLRTNALGATNAPTTAVTGLASYSLTFGGTRNRWGDYSFTDVDPNDDQTIWTFQEYADTPTNNWSVRAIQLKAPPPATLTNVSPSCILQGQASVNVTMTGTTSSGSEFFDPGSDPVPYANHLGVAVSGGVAVTGQPAIVIPGSPSTTPVTQVTAVFDTTGASLGLKNVTITNPDGQATTGVAILGVDTIIPTSVTASASAPQNNRIDVGWNDSSTASNTQYLVYRSLTTGGPYTQIATVPDSSPGVANGPAYTYHDDTVSGGVQYFYVVVATDGNCNSARSNEVNAVATGTCLLSPTFAGVTTVTSPNLATCTLTVGWNAGTSNCGSTLSYNVYRSTIPGFVPALANRIATGVVGTSYNDAVAIVGGTTYYYVVRAVDVSNSIEETNTVQRSGTPVGPITTSNFVDTFEGGQSGGGFDLAGWTKTSISGATNWAWSTARFHDGTHSWFAADVVGVNDKVLVSPSFGVVASTTMTFWHTYTFEGTTTTCYDGGTLEYTTNGGTTWTVVPVGDITSGAYTGTINSGFSNPLAGKRAWCAGTLGALTQVSVNLGADANLVNKTVQLRWHEGDDSSIASSGWYVDTVAVNNAGVAGACTAGTSGNADLSTTKAASPSSAVTGQDITYTVTATNNGPADATTVLVSDTTPANTTFQSIIAPAGWTCTTPAVGGTGSISCSATTLATNTQAVFTIVVRVNYCIGNGPVSNTATSSSANIDPNPANNAGTVSTPVSDPGVCDDGNACTLGDTCNGGTCVPGTAVVCDDGNACTANNCNPATGQCEYPAIVCNDNNVCTDDSCNPQTGCVYTNNTAACTDNSLCTTNDACSGGACVGTPVNCSDGNACTTDACNPATGQCSHQYNNNPCDDGNACTANDICTGPAVCGFNEAFDGVTAPALPSGWTSTVVGTGNVWTTVNTSSDTAPNSAFGFDGASVADEVLVTPPIPIISSSATLTFRNRWTFESNTSCFDAGVLEIKIGAGSFTDIVTAGGSFVGGGYTNTVSSSFSNPLAGRSAWCNVSTGYPAYLTTVVNLPAAAAGQTIRLQWRVGSDSSVASTGQNIDSIVISDACATVCTGSTVDCNDNNPCTDDSCNPQTGCVHTNNTAPCNDGNACTQGDTCQSGTCQGAPVTCTASDQCHLAGTCDPSTGQCSNPAAANGTACTDNNACTQGDTCQAGTCVGAPVTCTASDQCHLAGTCDPSTGQCSNPAAANGTVCDDGNACTVGDVCNGGTCAGTGIAAPPETQNLGVAADKTTYSWSAAPNATQYDVVRGSTAAFPVGPGGGGEVCFDNLAGTTLNDPAVPALGSGFWYLSRGENACGVGTFGTQSNGSPRTTTTCP